ncbi:hypothetical protein Poli38472_011217 [Pythium oligandrum]|uniref:FAD-binding FR-type domain-containing protein n=1 Tax=Pythium oligandrum TaxID=41045 RepID=A0A8K1CPV9_PYTOL|nr:hypothetical protein Poli38472_011217 [Pythium oligandrum]|eukprot:TMW67597.1 hypothetical protein Poli38472_011217 [Pythium oligandrum]
MRASWERQLPSDTNDLGHLLDSYAFSDILVGSHKVIPSFRSDAATNFAILGDNEQPTKPSVRFKLPPSTHHTTGEPRTHTRVGYYVLAVLIALCLFVYVIALLIFFTPFYQNSVQPYLARQFESSLRKVEDDTTSTKEAVAFIYILWTGLVPTLVASTLWLAFRGHTELRQVLSTSATARFFRKKPVFQLPCVERPVYMDLTCGEIGFMIILFVSNSFIFVQVLLQSRTMVSSPADEVFESLGKAFGFNTLFTMVWLILPLVKHCCWVESFGLTLSDRHKCHRWLCLIVLITSILHSLCYALSFMLRDELSEQMVPSWGAMYEATSTKVASGINAFGEIALGVILIMAIFSVPVMRRLWSSLASYVQYVGSRLALLAICVHYRPAIWWLLPSLVLYMTQRATEWAHMRYPVELVDVAPLPNGITRLTMLHDARSTTFTPGQLVYLHLPRISWFHWHPAVITSSPSRHPDRFTCYVQPIDDKAHASWPTTLQDVAKLVYATEQPPAVYIDGFHGISHRQLYRKYPCIVLFAGGFGITSVLSILEDLYDEAVATHLQGTTPTVWLLWTCRDICLFKEFEPLLLAIRALDPQEQRFHIRLFMTKVPTLAEFRYQPPPPLQMDDPSSTQQKGSRNAARGASPLAYQPQNHSKLCCWASRPFQEALASPSIQVVALGLVMGAVVAVSIIVEWDSHETSQVVLKALKDDEDEDHGMFRPLERMRDVVAVLSCCYVASIVALIHERFLEGRKGQMGPHQTTERRRRAMTNPTMLDQDDEEFAYNVAYNRPKSASIEECKEELEDGDMLYADPPDVMERLQILSLRPDLEKCLRAIAKSSPAALGPVGVFACGSEAFVQSVEGSTILTNTTTQDNAVLEFHSLRYEK